MIAVLTGVVQPTSPHVLRYFVAHTKRSLLLFQRAHSKAPPMHPLAQRFRVDALGFPTFVGFGTDPVPRPAIVSPTGKPMTPAVRVEGTPATNGTGGAGETSGPGQASTLGGANSPSNSPAPCSPTAAPNTARKTSQIRPQHVTVSNPFRAIRHPPGVGSLFASEEARLALLSYNVLCFESHSNSFFDNFLSICIFFPDRLLISFLLYSAECYKH